MIILDTDVLSDLMRDRPGHAVEQWLDRQPRTSIWTTSVTIMEIRFGLAVMPLGRRRAGLQREFEATLNETLEERVIAFDAIAAEATARLMAERRRRGTFAQPPNASIVAPRYIRKLRNRDRQRVALPNGISSDILTTGVQWRTGPRWSVSKGCQRGVA